ncbi:MAG: hypothetical protein K2M97_08295 [Muribaculaceae bacterium]|nr:hypothetical protein [Muribaculaceae bacterium]
MSTPATITLRLDADRAIERAVALSALQVARDGATADTSRLLGLAEQSALTAMAGVALGLVAVALRGYAVDVDPRELTLTLRLPDGTPTTDGIMLLRMTESAVAARIAGADAEAHAPNRPCASTLQASPHASAPPSSEGRAAGSYL